MVAGRRGGVTPWAGAVFVGVMVGKDVVLYRRWRRYYSPEPAERRLVACEALR
jgi:hypothetical protein